MGILYCSLNVMFRLNEEKVVDKKYILTRARYLRMVLKQPQPHMYFLNYLHRYLGRHFFGSCDSLNFYLFSWKEEEKEEGKEEKGKGEEREEGGERLVCIEDYNSILLFGWCGPMTLKLLLQYGGFAMICAVSNTPIHCSKSLVKHVLVYIGKLWWGAAKAGGCLWYCKRYRTYLLCVYVSCVLWSNDANHGQFISLIMFIGILCALLGWLVVVYVYIQKTHAVSFAFHTCILYATIASTVTEDAICIVTYCYLFVLIPIHTYWYDVVCLCCGTTLGILICRVATKPAQSIHSLYLPSAPRHIILINTLINSF